MFLEMKESVPAVALAMADGSVLDLDFVENPFRLAQGQPHARLVAHPVGDFPLRLGQGLGERRTVNVLAVDEQGRLEFPLLLDQEELCNFTAVQYFFEDESFDEHFLCSPSSC